MGCPHCESYWSRRMNTQFIINYDGSRYVIPEIELSTRVSDFGATRIDIATILQNEDVQFTFEKQLRNEEPQLVKKKSLGFFNYSLIACLLKTGALEDYKQEEKVSQE